MKVCVILKKLNIKIISIIHLLTILFLTLVLKWEHNFDSNRIFDKPKPMIILNK